MAPIDAQQSQICPECAREWGATTPFCGGCGARLAGQLLQDAPPSPPAQTAVRDRWWRRPAAGWAGAALLVAALSVVAATQLLDQGSSAPVEGEIALPDASELAAGTDGSRRATVAPQPEVTCKRDGQPIDCVRWIQRGMPQGLAPITDVDGTGPRLVVTAATANGPVLRILDVETGSQQQQWALPFDPVSTYVEGLDVLVVGGDHAHLWSLKTGTSRWEAPASGLLLQGKLLDNGLAYTQPPDVSPRMLEARAADTGEVMWRSEMFNVRPREPVLLTALAGNRILVRSFASPSAEVLDTTTGRPVWSSDPAGTASWSAGAGAILGIDVTTDGGSPSRTRLRAIDVRDGATLWERPVTLLRNVALDAANDLVITATDAQLTATGLLTGQVAWTNDVGPRERLARSAPGQPTATRRGSPIMTVDDRSGQVLARDPMTGTILWRRPFQEPRPYVAVLGDRVAIVGRRGAEVVDVATGAQLAAITGPRLDPLAVADPLVLTAGTTHVLRIDLPTPGDP